MYIPPSQVQLTINESFNATLKRLQKKVPLDAILLSLFKPSTAFKFEGVLQVGKQQSSVLAYSYFALMYIINTW